MKTLIVTFEQNQTYRIDISGVYELSIYGGTSRIVLRTSAEKALELKSHYWTLNSQVQNIINVEVRADEKLRLRDACVQGSVSVLYTEVGSDATLELAYQPDLQIGGGM